MNSGALGALKRPISTNSLYFVPRESLWKNEGIAPQAPRDAIVKATGDDNETEAEGQGVSNRASA